jgi:hypothetical protein
MVAGQWKKRVQFNSSCDEMDRGGGDGRGHWLARARSPWGLALMRGPAMAC